MKEQYNHDTSGIMQVPVAKGITITPEQQKIKMLEDQLSEQHHELTRLRRDIARLKDQLTEVANYVNRRG